MPSDAQVDEMRPKFPAKLRAALLRFPRIRCDRNIMSGQPCVGGRRIPAWVLAGRYAAGETIAFLASDYEISRADVTEAIRFVCWTSNLHDIKFWKFWE